MSPPAILVVTGASGAGKTAAVRALEAHAVAGVQQAVGRPVRE